MKQIPFPAGEYETDTADVVIYTGSDHYVPFDEWTTIACDFTGSIWPNGTSWEDEWAALSDQLEDEGHWFSRPTRHLSEQTLYNAVLASDGLADADWSERMKKLGIKCDVSANIYHTTATNPSFTGSFSLGNVWLQEANYPGLP